MAHNSRFIFVAILFFIISIIHHRVNSSLFPQTALVCATEQGLKVSVDDSKAFLANAYIQKDLFTHYSIKQDVLFRINLNILLVCLPPFLTNCPIWNPMCLLCSFTNSFFLLFKKTVCIICIIIIIIIIKFVILSFFS